MIPLFTIIGDLSCEYHFEEVFGHIFLVKESISRCTVLIITVQLPFWAVELRFTNVVNIHHILSKDKVWAYRQSLSFIPE